MKKYQLDKDELEWERALGGSPLKSDKKSAQNKKRLIAAAKAYGNKSKRVNVRLSEYDYLTVQETALREGIPYATFIGSIVHKFITGQLVEK